MCSIQPPFSPQSGAGDLGSRPLKQNGKTNAKHKPFLELFSSPMSGSIDQSSGAILRVYKLGSYNWRMVCLAVHMCTCIMLSPAFIGILKKDQQLRQKIVLRHCLAALHMTIYSHLVFKWPGSRTRQGLVLDCDTQPRFCPTAGPKHLHNGHLNTVHSRNILQLATTAGTVSDQSKMLPNPKIQGISQGEEKCMVWTTFVPDCEVPL